MVIDFGTNRKRICDFLLVRHSNDGHILHRFWDTATYWLQIAYFSYPSLIRRPAPYMFPLKFRGEVNREETRVMGLLYGESCMILTSTVFDWSTRDMTDGQTDRQTDGRAIDGAVQGRPLWPRVTDRQTERRHCEGNSRSSCDRLELFSSCSCIAFVSSYWRKWWRWLWLW